MMTSNISSGERFRTFGLFALVGRSTAKGWRFSSLGGPMNRFKEGLRARSRPFARKSHPPQPGFLAHEHEHGDMPARWLLADGSGDVGEPFGKLWRQLGWRADVDSVAVGWHRHHDDERAACGAVRGKKGPEPFLHDCRVLHEHSVYRLVGGDRFGWDGHPSVARLPVRMHPAGDEQRSEPRLSVLLVEGLHGELAGFDD